MNDKQQIDEITDIISEEYNSGNDSWYSIAVEIYNEGYRKIPEDSVVLTREEYERLKGVSNEKN